VWLPEQVSRVANVRALTGEARDRIRPVLAGIVPARAVPGEA